MNLKAIITKILNSEPLNALEKAEQTLRDVQFALGGENTIMSLLPVPPTAGKRDKAFSKFINLYYVLSKVFVMPIPFRGVRASV